MNGLLLTLAFVLAATLPLGALGWAAGRLAEPLGKTPRLRAALWSAVILVTLAAAVAVPLWRDRPQPAGAQSRTTVILAPVVETSTAAPAAAAPAWTALIAPGVELLVGLALLGSLIALVLLALRLHRTARMAETADPLDDAAVLDFVSRRAEAAGLVPPPVRVSAATRTAMLVGLRWPVILLPETLVARLDAEALRWICAHELAHLQRGDNWRIVADRLVAALVWFNPFLTDALDRRAAVREELCDATALRHADAGERRRYAATLVQALRLSGSSDAQPAFIRRQGAGHLMRLNAILQPTAQTSRGAVIGTTVLLAATALTSVAVSAAVARQLGATSAAAASAAASSKYRNVSAMELQRYCASRDPGEDGYCAGVIGGALTGRGVCPPKSIDGLGAEAKARPAILSGRPEAGESSAAFAARVLHTSFPCGGGGSYRFAIDGGKGGDGRTLVLSNRLKKGHGRTVVLDGKDLAGLDDIDAGDGRTKVIVKELSKDGAGHGGKYIMRSFTTKDGDGDGKTIVRTFSTKDGAAGDEKVIIIPKGEGRGDARMMVVPKGEGGGDRKVVVNMSKSETVNGQHSGHGIVIESDKTTSKDNVTVWEGNPTVRLVGKSAQDTSIMIDGKAMPEGTDLSKLPVDHVLKVEMHTDPGPDGKKHSTINIITKPAS